MTNNKEVMIVFVRESSSNFAIKLQKQNLYINEYEAKLTFQSY